MGVEHDILVALENSCIEESRTIKPKGAIEWSWRKKLYDNVFKVFPDILDQGKTDFCLFCAVVFAAQMELNVERAKLGETCNIRFEWKSLLTRFLELHGYKGGQGEQEKNELVKNLMNPSEAIYVYRDAVPWCFKCLGVTAEIDIANSDDMVQARVKSEIDYGGSDPMLHAPVMGNSGGKMTSALEMSFKYFWRRVDSDMVKRLEKSSLLNKNQAKTKTSALEMSFNYFWRRVDSDLAKRLEKSSLLNKNQAKTKVNLPLSGYKRYEGDHRLSKGEILYYVEKGKAVVVTILVGEQFHHLEQNEIYAWIPAYDYDKEEWIDDPEPHAIVLVGNGDAGNLLEHEQYHPFANSHGMEFADGGCGSVFYKALFTNFIMLEMDAHPRQVNHTISQLNVPLPQRAPAKLKAPPPSPAKTSPQQLPAPTGPLPLPAPPRYSSRPPPPCDIAHRNPRPRMAVPGGRNGLNDDEEDHAEAFAAASEDDEEAPLPPHLRALADAAQTGNAAALRAALDNYAGSIDDPVEDGDTVLHLACLYGHLPCVQLLLERGASLECKHEEGAIALHEACAGGFTEIVQCILNFAANTAGCASCMLSTVDAEGDTPLHHAARGEHMDTVKLLLEAGACPKKENSYGQAPAEMADQDTEVRALLTAKQVEASVHMGN